MRQRQGGGRGGVKHRGHSLATRIGRRVQVFAESQTCQLKACLRPKNSDYRSNRYVFAMLVV